MRAHLFAVEFRKLTLDRAVALAVVLVPAFFNAVIFSLHSACLLAALAGEKADHVSGNGLTQWLLLFAMCFASYFTSLTPDIGRHFQRHQLDKCRPSPKCLAADSSP